MQPTTSYSFGDVVLLPLPFTDQQGSKKRPGVVVSSARLLASGTLDVVIMPITSLRGTRQPVRFGTLEVQDWKQSGLLNPSLIKPVFATVEKPLILRRLGSLDPATVANLKALLPQLIG